MHPVNSTPFPVTYLDGKTDTVMLHRLSLRELYTFMQLLSVYKTPDLVALCARRPLEWIDSLADDSFAALAALCIQPNFTRAMTIAKSDPVMAQHISPHLLALASLELSAAKTLPIPTRGNSGPDSSPAPAPSASAEENGSASSTSLPTGSSPSSTNTPASAPTTA